MAQKRGQVREGEGKAIEGERGERRRKSFSFCQGERIEMRI
jgi:hypothetical protein